MSRSDNYYWAKMHQLVENLNAEDDIIVFWNVQVNRQQVGRIPVFGN